MKTCIVLWKVARELSHPDEDQVDVSLDELKDLRQIVLTSGVGKTEQGVQVEVEFASYKLG